MYNKGDNATAIDNYIKTIGHLEPSYVIKRFLDAHKINFLTAYLQALHKQGLANEDHTTLLLNCYTKLKDQNKLDEFIFKGTLCQFLEFENTIVFILILLNYSERLSYFGRNTPFIEYL